MFNPNENDVKRAFDMLREQNDKYDETYHETAVPSELIDEAEKKYNWLMQLAQRPETKQAAQDNGINVRSWKNPASWRSNAQYHDFVATTAVALDRLSDIKQHTAESIKNVIDTEQKVESRLTVNDDGLQEVLEYLQADEGSEKRQSGLGTVTGEGWRAEQQTPFEKATDSILQEGENDARYTKVIAQLAALLKYRDQIESGLNANKNIRF